MNRHVEQILGDEWETDEELRLLFTKCSTDDLHQVALTFNRDCGSDELRHVIGHPNCSWETALLIFWLSEPMYYLKYENAQEVEKCNRANFEFQCWVKARLLEDRNWTRGPHTDFKGLFGLSASQIREIQEADGIPSALKIS